MLKKQPDQDTSKYTSMVVKMVVVVVAGTWGGLTLDKQIGWKFPLFTVVLSLVSVALAIYILILDTSRK